jgi:hypothetical protein
MLEQQIKRIAQELNLNYDPTDSEHRLFDDLKMFPFNPDREDLSDLLKEIDNHKIVTDEYQIYALLLGDIIQIATTIKAVINEQKFKQDFQDMVEHFSKWEDA